MRSLRFLLGFALLGLAMPALAVPKAEPKLRLEPVKLDRTLSTQSLFVRADRSGRVSLLDGDRLAVFPLAKTGKLGEPTLLQPTNEAVGPVLQAALSPAGDQWLLLAGGEVRWFLNGKEKPLPALSWLPWSVGFVGNKPVIVVMPRPLPDAVLRLSQLGAVPWLLVLGNDQWEPLVEHPDLSAETAWKERSKMNQWVEKYAAFLASARDGKLWMASQYAPRVQRLSPAGRPLLYIELPRSSSKSSPEADHSTAAQEAQSVEKSGNKSRFQAFTAKPVIDDLVEGADRAIYLLVHPSGEDSLALDRYEPVRGVVERVHLASPGAGRFTLASGKDGLYLAPYNRAEAPGRISWEALDAAKWKLLEETEIRSQPPSESR